MKKYKTLIISLLIVGQAFAQYEVKRVTINNGGSIISGGQYQISSSIGQIDASNMLSGGSYTMNGGFWHENLDLIYKNGFE